MAFTPGCVAKQASFNQNVSPRDFSAPSSNTIWKVSVVAVAKGSSLRICGFAAQHKRNQVLERVVKKWVPQPLLSMLRAASHAPWNSLNDNMTFGQLIGLKGAKNNNKTEGFS